MRLSPEECYQIKNEAKAVFGKNVIVRLFGSRVDDTLKGGDIDLHLVVERECKTLKKEIEYELRLIKAIGEQKIDIILYDKNRPGQPIDAIAMETGVVL